MTVAHAERAWLGIVGGDACSGDVHQPSNLLVSTTNEDYEYGSGDKHGEKHGSEAAREEIVGVCGCWSSLRRRQCKDRTFLIRKIFQSHDVWYMANVLNTLSLNFLLVRMPTRIVSIILDYTSTRAKC